MVAGKITVRSWLIMILTQNTLSQVFIGKLLQSLKIIKIVVKYS